jgi:hypothetical protein
MHHALMRHGKLTILLLLILPLAPLSRWQPRTSINTADRFCQPRTRFGAKEYQKFFSLI